MRQVAVDKEQEAKRLEVEKISSVTTNTESLQRVISKKQNSQLNPNSQSTGGAGNTSADSGDSMVPMGALLFVLAGIAFYFFKTNKGEVQKKNTAFGAGAKDRRPTDQKDLKQFMCKETMDEQELMRKMSAEELKAHKQKKEEKYDKINAAEE